MALLGFDAIGTLPVGTVPDSGATPLALIARATAMARALAGIASSSALAAKASASARAKVSVTAASALTGKSASQIAARSPAGFAISGRAKAQATARAPGGYVLYGRVTEISSAGGSPHIEIQTVPTRRALLLNSASVTASYWKGHS